MKWFKKKTKHEDGCGDPRCTHCNGIAAVRGANVLAHLKGGGTVRDGNFQEWEIVSETDTGAFLKNLSVEQGKKIKVPASPFGGIEREYDPSAPVHWDVEEMGERLHILKDGIPPKL